MTIDKKHSKLFAGLLLHSVILSFSPLLFFRWTDDVNLVLIFAALAAFIPIIVSMGKTEFIHQLTDKREKISPFMFLVLILAPVGTNIIGAYIGIGVNHLLALLGAAIPDTGAEMAREVAETPGFTLALYTCLIAPLFEEFAFRNYLLRGMEKPRPWLAIFLSGLMFALMHGNLEQSFSLIVTAMFFSYLAQRYSMVVPIAAHVANNTIFYIFTAIQGGEGSVIDTINTVVTLGGIIAFFIALASLIRYIRKDRPKRTLAKAEYVKNPFFILYFVYWIGMIILNDFIL